MLVNNTGNSLHIGTITTTLNDGEGTGQYPFRVTERHPDSLIANIKTQTARLIPPDNLT
jgi:hypothetical protein